MRRAKQSNIIYVTCFLITLLVTVLFLHNTTILLRTTSYAEELWLSYVQFMSNIVTDIKDTSNNIVNRQYLRLENSLLKTKIKLLETELLVTQRNDIDLAKLKQQLNYQSSYKYNITTTKLFAITNSNFTKEAYIEAGSAHGLKEGQSVLFDNFLIGRISEIYQHYAKILLIFDSRSKISATTENSRNNILIEGRNNTELFVKYLPETTEIVNSEIVVTSNYATLYPAGIAIGRIMQTGDKYHITVPYQLHDIELVQVITSDVQKQ